MTTIDIVAEIKKSENAKSPVADALRKAAGLTAK